MYGNSNKAIKAGIGYTIGNILVRGITFLTIPLFSRLMTTEDFGIFNVFLSYESILFVIIGLAIHTSIRSAKLEFPGRIDHYTSSVSLIYIINTSVFLLIALIFGTRIGQLLGFSKSIVIILVLYSFGSAVLSLYNHRISLDYSYKKYLIVATVNTFSNIGVSLLFILTVFNDDRVLGRILGATIPLICLTIILLALLYKKAAPTLKKEYWKFAIKYSIPIVPHGISQVLLAQFDRIMIRFMVSNSAAGIYSLAGNIKLILTIISESITTAWSTWFYEEIERGHVQEIQKRAKQFCGVFAIFSIGLMSMSPEIILVLGGNKYLEGKFVAIPMIIDAFLLFIYSVIVQAEYYKKKTLYVMYGTLIASLINIVTNYIFIKKYGFIAAAYTTLFSYVIYLVLHIIISKKMVLFYVLEIKWLIVYLGVICLSAVANLVFSSFVFARYSICIIIIIPFVIWLFRDFDMTRNSNGETIHRRRSGNE